MKRLTPRVLSVTMMALLLAQEPAAAADRKPLRPSSYPNAGQIHTAMASPAQPLHSPKRRGLKGLLERFRSSSKNSPDASAKDAAKKSAKPQEPAKQSTAGKDTLEVLELPPARATPTAADAAAVEHVATIHLGREDAKQARSAGPAVVSIGGPAGAPAFGEAFEPSRPKTAGKAPASPAPVRSTQGQPEQREGSRTGVPAGPGPRAGQPTDTKKVTTPRAATVANWHGGYHQVTPGEDLSAIAGRYGVSEQAIQRYNPVPAKGELPAGRKLYVPAAGHRLVFTPDGPIEMQVEELPPLEPSVFGSQTSGTASRPTATPAASPTRQAAVTATKPADDDGPGPWETIKGTVSGVFDKLGNWVHGHDRKTGAATASRSPAPAPGNPRATASVTPPEPALFRWPLSGTMISSFGPRRGVPHNGIDLSAPKGTPIQAAADGKVIFASTMRGYGNVIILDHGNRYFTVYAHNKQNLVKKGSEARPVNVKAGQTIALVGQTGNAKSPHLHFEARFENKAVNPMPLLPRGPEGTQASKPTVAMRNDPSRV